MRYLKEKILVAVDILIIALTVISILMMLFGSKSAFMGHGILIFRYFTTDSNILCAMAAAAVMPHDLAAASGGQEPIPTWKRYLLLMGTSAVTLTFLTVLMFLGPLFGFWNMLKSFSLMSMHLVTPLLAYISYALLRGGMSIRGIGGAAGAIPTAIYGVVYLFFVVARGTWPDFYAFTMIGNNAAVLAVMILVSCAISLSLVLANRRRNIGAGSVTAHMM